MFCFVLDIYESIFQNNKKEIKQYLLQFTSKYIYCFLSLGNIFISEVKWRDFAHFVMSFRACSLSVALNGENLVLPVEYLAVYSKFNLRKINFSGWIAIQNCYNKYKINLVISLII